MAPSLEEVNPHRHFGTGALWLRQAEIGQHFIDDLEDFREGPESYDDDQDLYFNGIQDQAVLSEVEGEE